MDYGLVFDAAAKEWNVDPTLLRAVSAQESGGNAGAVSKAGARGLMGVMPQTGREMGVTDPADPAQNIYAGAKYLSQALDAEKSPEDALRYYHGGPDWRKAYGPESQGYVPAVSAHYQRIAAANAKGAPAVPSTAPSFDDFLARTGASDKAPPAADAQAAFLARTGAAEAPPAVAPGGLARNAAAGVLDAAGTVGNVVANPAGNLIGKPLATGLVYLHDLLAPHLGGQRFPDDVRNMLLGDNVAQPASAAISGIGNALGGADPAQVPANTTAELLMRKGVGGAATMGLLGPSGLAAPVAGAAGAIVGDRLATLAPDYAKPIVEMGGNLLGMAAAVPTMAGVNKLQGAVTRFANPLEKPAIAPDIPTMTVRPDAVPSEASPITSGDAAPQSVGAAASAAGEAGMTPAQVLAYRSTAEGQKLLEPQPVGVPDRAQYVQGSNPNTAEIEQTVNTARELKSLGMTSEPVSQEARQIAAENNDARAQHFAQTAGSDVDVLNAKEARAAQAEKDLEATWANKTEANASPVIDAANKIKASPDGKRPLVRNAVDAVTKELFDKDGNPETDPEQLYGVRKHIDDLMSKEAGADDPKSVRAMANLRVLKAALDDVIEKAAPGFGEYLKNFSEASKRIDEMEVLQKHEPRLFDAQNRMTYNKVQTMMRQIVDSRQAPGINPYQSITDDTMQRLWALRDDLRRSASSQELARTPGSDTVQNAWDAAKGLAGGMVGEAAIHGGANLLFGPLGSGVAAITKNAVGNLLAGRTAKRQTARGMQLLHPDPKTLYNPLAGP